jgi:hypothetical protein
MKLMRVCVVSVMLLCLVVPTAEAKYTITWGAEVDGFLPEINGTLRDSSGTLLTTDGLIFQVVIDVNNDTLYSTMVANNYWWVDAEKGDTDTYNANDDRTFTSAGWTTTTTGSGANLPSANTDMTAYDDSKFYIRWFDTTVIGDIMDPATEAGLIYNDNAHVAGIGGQWETADDLLGTPPSPNTTPTYGFIDWNHVGSGGIYSTGGSQSGDGWQTMAPIPEPGTMALVAIGLATVGMRRRKHD